MKLIAETIYYDKQCQMLYWNLHMTVNEYLFWIASVQSFRHSNKFVVVGRPLQNPCWAWCMYRRCCFCHVFINTLCTLSCCTSLKRRPLSSTYSAYYVILNVRSFIIIYNKFEVFRTRYCAWRSSSSNSNCKDVDSAILTNCLQSFRPLARSN